MSVPNQRIVKIHKPKYRENFLQIGIDEWQAAVKVMTKCEFALYLYLAGNADGFNLELSRQAFENATGYKKTAYSDAVNKLIQLGYIVHKGGNFYHFYTSPRRERERAQKTNGFGELPSGKGCSVSRSAISEKSENLSRHNNTEINNINKTDKIINNAKRKMGINQTFSIGEIHDMTEREYLGF